MNVWSKFQPVFVSAMKSIINFKPLYGLGSEEPVCFLLELDDFCILLDCGWNERFDAEYVDILKKYVYLFSYLT